jgi:Protein affecting phage T7 exclusion by the F plasmid
LLVAAGFLLTPGLVTDALGLLIVVPVTRYPFRWGVKRWVLVPYFDQKTDGFVTGRIYTGGFPGNDAGEKGGGGNAPGSPGSDSGTGPKGSDTGQPGPGVRDVEYEEVDDRNGGGN